MHTLTSIAQELDHAGHPTRAQVLRAAECRIEHLEQIILELRHSLRNLNDSIRIVLDHDAKVSVDAATASAKVDELTKQLADAQANAVDPALSDEVKARAELLSPEAPPAA